jgi:drug/metabolite transporter (DMT)-like permease
MPCSAALPALTRLLRNRDRLLFEARRGLTMSDPNWLWAFFTLVAAAAQTVRNATQSELTAKLGTVGAAHVRFLFGCPFALLFLAAVMASGAALPRPGATFWPWLIGGALMQIFATALMLAAMKERSFVVAIAYIKTEPVQVALFGLIFLGDAVSLRMAGAIAIATVGVIVVSIGATTRNQPRIAGRYERPALVGLAAGAAFALSAIGYRGAILSLHDDHHLIAATFTMVAGLLLQSVLLSLYLAICETAVLAAIMRAWRPSLFAGFMGALATQFWFLAFALATAANVRTLALVEVVFAQAISRFVLGQKVSRREAAGIALIVAGVALLFWT